MEYAAMRVTLLKHTIKAPTEYSYAYILITHQFNIDDILTARANGKKNSFLRFYSRKLYAMDHITRTRHNT